MTRRRLVLFLPVALLATGSGYALLQPAMVGSTLDAETAFRRTRAGDLLLIDIRQPDEWAATGSPQGAHRLDLRSRDFLDRLSMLANGDRNRPIALICATGGRSARLARALTRAGFTNVLDVSEGMLGSSAGPGWLGRGLPTVTD
ncbi:rhodanese-like domain-containing protein [Rhodobacter calidifons]|uniref:Rhodanese-like domain-containing protein n=1 Tax=Rhodobacter calidifons TaxID=2715277 RepID=A0ABX0G3G0_9RHOB|nr:rhodanese-like domain-containing protein [Rhodobacter calidifons]NHB75423.1 rhodanese-like domain-containing protein [Rhodobacter calidifons]